MSYCRYCGSELSENADFCVSCGVTKGAGNKYCPNCGTPTSPEQAVCIKCGVRLDTTTRSTNGGVSKGSSKFVRVKNGKIIGGVFSGAEKTYGINRWIGRLIALFIPLWPIWLIAYIVICTQTEITDE